MDTGQWFTFNGVSCADFGIVVLDYTVVIIPASRCSYLDISGRDGTYELTDDSRGDITLQMQCAVLCEDEYQLRERSSAAAAWLRGKGELRMWDDPPDRFRCGRIVNEVSVSNFVKWGTFTLQWRCDPYMYGERRTIPLNRSAFVDGTVPARGEFCVTVGSAAITSANVAGMILSGSMSAGAEIKIDTLRGAVDYMGQRRDGLLALSSRYAALQPGLITVPSDLQGEFTYEPRWH